MKRILRLAVWSGLALMTMSVVLAQGQSVAVGGSLNLSIAAEGLEGAIPVTLTIETPVVVNLLAQSADDTDPVFLVRDQYGRDLTVINDNPASVLAVKPLDAVLDNTLLIPGVYTILVGRNGMAGEGEITFSVSEGSAGVIGIGQIQLIDAQIGVNERYVQPLEFQAGELVSLAAIGISPELDLRLNIRDADGNVLINNDDNATFDIFLSDLDPRIYQFRVPATGTYSTIIRPFSNDMSGAFKIVVQRHGILSGEPSTEVFTGTTENRARNALDVEFTAGEIVRITARAIDPSVDPEIDLLTPDDIFIASNDDHGTNATDLGRFDSRIERVIIEESGTYELDVNSVSGRGEFAVTIERLGIFAAAEAAEVDAGAGYIITPVPPQPTVVPEVTAEPTA